MNLETLIASIREHGTGFYREHWGDTDRHETLPVVNTNHFVEKPLSSRRYKDARSLVKIVHAPEGSFLSEWAFEDIAQESFGVVTKRPFVYMTSAHEAIEKSMWCYEHNMVPLIGEKDPDIAAYTAKRYDVDQLITDPVALHRIHPYLEKRAHKLASLTIVSDMFDIAQLLPYTAFAQSTRLLLARPETGGIAEARLTETPHFTPLPECLVDTTPTLCTVTKMRLLVTPIVRYRFETTAFA